jgi:glycogen debranching enzyme
MISPEEQLRKQYGKRGIYAGSTHFHDYWCRDSMFASLGALSIGDYEIVGKTLNNFLNNLRDDGHVAMRIGSTNQILQYLGFPTKHGVHHRQDKGNNTVYDSNSLLLIVAEKYECLSGDILDRKKIAEVIRWLDEHDRDGLLYERKYASWDDSLKLTGARLYTNVCYYGALTAISEMLNDPVYAERAEKTKSEIQQWWNGSYFSDGTNKACMVAGNLLSILWNVASPEQAEKILKHIANRKTITPPAGFWKPTWKDVYLLFFLIHLEDYHGMMEWSWLSWAEIAAYRKIGDNAEADARTAAMMRQVQRYGTLHEVYKNDKPVRRLIYRSEKDFAWGLGMLLASRGKLNPLSFTSRR